MMDKKSKRKSKIRNRRDMWMRYAALIVAAGSGERMGLGYNKLLYRLHSGNTVLEETLQIFLKDERCAQLVLVINEAERESILGMYSDQRVVLVKGGSTRQESVYHGLQAVQEDKVLIHDGARPWLSKECLDRIVAGVEQYPACLLGVALKDTIKQVDEQGFVVMTHQRDILRQAQTPQAFDTRLILDCYKKAAEKGIVASDDAQLVELCTDVAVRMIEGSYENRKVTTREDLDGK